MREDKKCKVLHIVHTMTYGGIETFLMSMLRCYDRNRFHMDILYSGPWEGEYSPEVRALGAKLISCRLGYEQIRFVYRLYKLLRREKYDTVNSHIADMGGGVILAAWLARIPVRIASYHTSLPDMGLLRNLYLRIMRRIIVRTTTAITTSSPMVSESHFSRVPTPDDMVHPIAYGVDSASFAEKSYKTLDLKQFDFDRDNIIVGHVGSYRPQKNHKALLRIAARVVQELPNARFLLCGAACSSPRVSVGYKEQIEREIAKLGLWKYVAQVSGFKDIREFYSAIDVFVLPSRHEGMPISLIEAQAMGKPVVASRINGIIAATAPEMRGNLFEIDDIEPFAQCVIELLKDKQKRDTLGRAGQEFVRKELDIKITVQKYEKLYLPKNGFNKNQ